jgi:hypothetical protein
MTESTPDLFLIAYLLDPSIILLTARTSSGGLEQCQMLAKQISGEL